MTAAGMRPYKAPAQIITVQVDTVSVAPSEVDTAAVELPAVDTVEEIIEAEPVDIRPAPLKPGDCIGIFGISNYIDSTALLYGVSVFENWGLRVKFADNQIGRAHV